MNKVLLIILFFISFVLAWCVRMDVTQDLDKNWLANIKVSYDITTMNSIKEEMGENDWNWIKLTDSSEEYCSGNGSAELNLINYKCTIIDKDHYVVEWQFDFSKLKSFYTEKWVYFYNLSKWFKELNFDKNNDPKIKTKEELEQEKQMFLAMWIDANILIKMPWTIIDNNVWNLENNLLSCNYIDLISLDNLYVFSKDNDVDLSDTQIAEILNKFKTNDLNVDLTNSEDKLKYSKQKILSISKLRKAKQAKYIIQIDRLVKKTDNKKLTIIFGKIQQLKNKNTLIEYLESLIYLKVYG